MFHLAILLIVTSALLFMLVFYRLQFDSNNVVVGQHLVTSEPRDPAVLEIKCKAIIKLDDPSAPCPECRGANYIKEVVTAESSHIILGQQVAEGTYCVQENLPACDQHKGYLIIDDASKPECICRYPEYFGGPSCNKQVACSTIDGNIYPLVDQDGKPIDTSQKIDYYKERIRCACGDTINGYKQAAIGLTNCVIDPCLYPVPNREGGFLNDTCICPNPLRHREYWNINSPCSVCVFGSENLNNNETIESFPVDCFTKFNIVTETINKFPCFNFETAGECGTAKIHTTYGSSILDGGGDNLSKITR